jgi:hypothetical protein
MASEPRCRELWVQQLVTTKHLNQKHENLGINKLLNNKGSMVDEMCQQVGDNIDYMEKQT